MAAMTNLLVKDDAATPIEVTLAPVTDTPEPLWRSSIANVPIDGQMRLTASSIKLKNGNYKTTVKLEVPVMETLGASGTSAGYVAPPRVAYVTTSIFTMFADRRSTTQDRANALRLTIGCIQGASATTATGVLANTAAGSAWLSSTAAIPLLVTAMVVPN